MIKKIKNAKISTKVIALIVISGLFTLILAGLLFMVISNAVAWFVVAPSLDILIYAEPANKVYTQGAVAGVLNMITVAVLGTILLYSYAKSRVKKGSLDRE